MVLACLLPLQILSANTSIYANMQTCTMEKRTALSNDQQTHLAGVGIVQSHVTTATLKHPRHCKVERHGLGMAQMQISVGLRGEPSADRPRTDPLPLGLDLLFGKCRCGRDCHRRSRCFVIGGALFVTWRGRSNLEQTLRLDARPVLNDFGDEVWCIGEAIGGKGESGGGNDNHCHGRQQRQRLSGDQHVWCDNRGDQNSLWRQPQNIAVRETCSRGSIKGSWLRSYEE